LNTGAPLPANDFQSALGYDAFHPDTNFRDPYNIANQNGVIFFPGGVPLYAATPSGGATLIGGYGASGDGVDQDDIVAAFGAAGYAPLNGILSADQVTYKGVSLPYQAFQRNPDAL
jgi:hypothetical protein